MDAITLKEIIVEQNRSLIWRESIEREKLFILEANLNKPHIVIVAGIRRSGKSTLLHQFIKKNYPNGVYFLNFEDERLLNFTVQDFNRLYEIFVELYGENKVFFFDEIQNIPKWEVFVRRMQDRGFKFYITGSNASLLSKELGTRLTGRSVLLELYPFSFSEFLKFHHVKYDSSSLFDTVQRGLLKKYFNEYLEKGGMPEFLIYQDSTLLKRTYEDILYRDIVARYEIKETKSLRELGLFLMSHPAQLFSYNNLKNMLQLGSVNTVKNYIDYLENSFLIFTINRFSFSLKQQIMTPKKSYVIDNGLAESIAFQFSKNKGRYLENLVFLELKRRGEEIYYYKTADDGEVDFLIREGRHVKTLIQVTEHLNQEKTRAREINALVTAMKEVKCHTAFILTEDLHEDIKVSQGTILVRPVYQWLLQEQ